MQEVLMVGLAFGAPIHIRPYSTYYLYLIHSYDASPRYWYYKFTSKRFTCPQNRYDDKRVYFKISEDSLKEFEI